MNEKRLPQNKLPAEQDILRHSSSKNQSTVFIETKEEPFFKAEICVNIRMESFSLNEFLFKLTGEKKTLAPLPLTYTLKVNRRKNQICFFV